MGRRRRLHNCLLFSRAEISYHSRPIGRLNMPCPDTYPEPPTTNHALRVRFNLVLEMGAVFWYFVWLLIAVLLLAAASVVSTIALTNPSRK